MAAWLLKTEPSDYSLGDLERDGSTRWDGVGNNAALLNMRKMELDERCFIYHTGKEKAVVGIAKVTTPAYPDPEADNAKMLVVDVAFEKRLKRPVTLAEIKADPNFAEWQLVRQSRLSVVPTPPEIWKRVVEMGGK